jgi:putative tRNA adenosine deaminase-associated protein
MAVQSVQSPPGVREQALPGYAVAAIREDGRWRCTRLTPEALVDLDAAITELRELRSTGAVVGLLDVDDEFFVLLRPVPGGIALMVSDAVAALDYDVAADALDLLRVELPPEYESDDADDAPVWPEGDLAILADLGLPADELEVLAAETELYPDEQLAAIGRRCGFADALAEIVDESSAGGASINSLQ